MKKVLLSSVAALAVFAAAAPVLAEGGVNGGANNPRGPQDTDVASKYYDQSEFVSARTVEEYLNGHMGEIQAEAAQDPAVVAAKAALDAVEGGDHKYTAIKAAYDEAYNNAFLKVRNVYVQKFQTVQNTAKKAEGRYYILNETPEQKNARYEAEHGAQAEDKTAPSQEDVKKAQTSAEKAKKAEEKSKAVKENKSGSKAEAKALPNTAAVK